MLLIERATSAVSIFVLYHFDSLKRQPPQRNPQRHVYTAVCMCVYGSVFEKALGSKCQTNPQCSAAGGERCLCFLISLLRKKPLALSCVPSASRDNMTHAVVPV